MLKTPLRQSEPATKISKSDSEGSKTLGTRLNRSKMAQNRAEPATGSPKPGQFNKNTKFPIKPTTPNPHGSIGLFERISESGQLPKLEVI